MSQRLSVIMSTAGQQAFEAALAPDLGPDENEGLANQMMLDGVLNQFRIGFQTEGLHDSIFVKGDSTRFHIQDICNFLHRLAFRKQLQDLALPPSDSLFCNVGMTAS